MKFKLTGLEIESDKIISEVYLNIRYENDDYQEEVEITEDGDNDQIESGNIFKDVQY